MARARPYGFKRPDDYPLHRHRSWRDPQLTPSPRWFFFGGTFDPPHRGHYKIVRHIIDNEPGARVVVMPAASAPLRSDERLFSYRERFHLLRHLFAREISNGEVVISVLERSLPSPSYTVNTLSALAQRCSQKVILVIGADQAEKLPRWHRAQDLMDSHEFLVFARRGNHLAAIPGFNARYVEDFAEDISATGIRAQLAGLTAGARLEAALAAISGI